MVLDNIFLKNVKPIKEDIASSVAHNNILINNALNNSIHLLSASIATKQDILPDSALTIKRDSMSKEVLALVVVQLDTS